MSGGASETLLQNVRHPGFKALSISPLSSRKLRVGICVQNSGITAEPGNVKKSMNEAQTKALYLDAIIRRGEITSSVVVASELAVSGHTRRIDLALLGRRFVGVEIKSERDNLLRLQDQITSYLPYFDEIRVVVATKHVRRAIEFSHSSSSVWSIDQAGSLQLEKPAEANEMNLAYLLRLLPVKTLQRYVEPEFKGISKNELISNIVSNEKRSTKSQIMEAIRLRFRSSSDTFKNNTGLSIVDTESLSSLSRFSERRTARQDVAENKASVQKAWEQFSGSASPKRTASV